MSGEQYEKERSQWEERFEPLRANILLAVQLDGQTGKQTLECTRNGIKISFNQSWRNPRDAEKFCMVNNLPMTPPLGPIVMDVYNKYLLNVLALAVDPEDEASITAFDTYCKEKSGELLDANYGLAILDKKAYAKLLQAAGIDEADNHFLVFDDHVIYHQKAVSGQPINDQVQALLSGIKSGSAVKSVIEDPPEDKPEESTKQEL